MDVALMVVCFAISVLDLSDGICELKVLSLRFKEKRKTMLKKLGQP